MNYLCLINTPESSVPHLAHVDADDWPEALLKADAAIKVHRHASSAALFKDDILIALVEPGQPLPSGPLRTASHPVVAAMPAEIQIAIGRHGIHRHARSGDRIAPNDEMIFMLRGALGTLTSPSGPCSELAGPGDLRNFELAFMEARPTPRIAVVDSEWIGLPPKHLQGTVSRGWLERMYARQAVSRIRSFEVENACIGRHTVSQRLALLLLRLQRMNGSSQTIAISQQLLSTILGVQRTSVVSAAKRLQGELIVKTVRGNIKILDLERLQGVCCGCKGR